MWWDGTEGWCLSPVCPSVWLTAVCLTVSSDLTVLLFLAVWTPLRLRPAAGRCSGDKFLTSTAAKCLFQFSLVGLIYLMHLPNTPVIFFSLSAFFLNVLIVNIILLMM